MSELVPTKYRISTITSTACIGSTINLPILYDSLNPENNGIEPKTKKYINTIINGIVYIEFGSKKTTTISKGYSKKALINRRKVKPAKRFDNQLTIVYCHINEVTNIKSNVNIKIFKNGNIQMTGLKSIDLGSYITDIVINIIKNIYDTINKDIVDDIEKLVNTNNQIRLINTDYKIGFEIKREVAFKIIVHEYDNVCSYEPCIYPGVKMQYFWNINNPLKNGICNCFGKKCYTKRKSGNGYGDGNCKKITIAIFQSGCCIITGSQFKEQIDDCYTYINKLLYKNIDRIEKKNTLLNETLIVKKKIILRITDIKFI
jgi:TATA-box binding protein (TBP) (component of TFIID and TFIIIB)